MGGKVKVLWISLAVILALFLCFFVFIKLYLTKDRVKHLITDLSQGLLGREVSFGEVEVGVFKGAVFKDVVVKEEGGKGVFLRIKELGFSYKPLSLLKGKLDISSITVVDPEVVLVRKKNGHFNYETLKILEEPSSITLPFSIESLELKNAHITFRDDMKKLPTAKGVLNVKLGLSLGAKGLSFKGSGDLSFNVSSKTLTLPAKVSFSFDKAVIDAKGSLRLGSDVVAFSLNLKNYLEKPHIDLEVSGDRVHLENLISLGALIPEKSGGEGPSFKGSLAGRMDFKKVLYKNLEAKDFKAMFSMKGGVLDLENVSFSSLDGSFLGKGKVFFGKILSYKGSAELKGLNLGLATPLLFGFSQGGVKGTFSFSSEFSGIGVKLINLKRSLKAKGSFSMEGVSIEEPSILSYVSDLLLMRRLKSLEVGSVSGNFTLDRWTLNLSLFMNSTDLTLSAKGPIKLDDGMDVPAVLKLSPKLSGMLLKKYRYLSIVKNQEGWLEIPLRFRGSVKRPRPIPDVKRVIERGVGIGIKRILSPFLGH